MDSKMTTATTINNQTYKKQKQKWTKQTSRTEQNQRNGDHMEGCQWGSRGRNEEKATVNK